MSSILRTTSKHELFKKIETIMYIFHLVDMKYLPLDDIIVILVYTLFMVKNTIKPLGKNWHQNFSLSTAYVDCKKPWYQKSAQTSHENSISYISDCTTMAI